MKVPPPVALSPLVLYTRGRISFRLPNRKGVSPMKKALRSCAAALLLAASVLAQGGGASITPGDNLVVEGVPAVPAALAEDVRRYTEFRTAGLSSWHPTRREMLIGTRFGD